MQITPRPYKDLIHVLFLGLAGGLLLVALQKTLTILQVFNFSSVFNATLIFCFFSFGVAGASRKQKSILVGATALIVFSALLLAAALTNRHFTAMSIASDVYYPVPMPKSGSFNKIALILCLFISPAVFYPFGARLAAKFQAPGFSSQRGLTAFFIGTALGIGAVNAFAYFGPFVWLAIGLGVWSMVLFKPLQAAVGVILLAGVFAGFQYNPTRTFFTFAVMQYDYKGGAYGRDVKVDFVAFRDDGCIGTVIDNIMMTWECTELDWLSPEFDYMFRTLINPLSPYPSQLEMSALAPNEKPPWQAGLDVLDVGRSGGGYCRGIELYSGPNHNQTVEFDPAMAAQLLNNYTKYTTGIYTRPDAKVHTGDFRTNLEKLAEKGETFDYIFLSGIGTKTYLLPRSYNFVEHFLLTEEGTRLIFDRLLKPGGMLFLDWGSSDTMEAQWFVGSFPKDAAISVFWTTYSDFPMSGSPMILVFASKDHRKIEAIDTRLRRLSGFLSVDYRPGLERFKTTDNRPNFQLPMQHIILVFHLLLLPILPLGYVRLRKRTGKEYGRISALAFGAGAGAGFGESLFAGFNPLVIGPFDLPGWALLHMGYWAGMAAGALLTTLFMRRLTRPACIAGVALFAAGVLLLLQARGTPFVFAAALLSGAGCGLLLTLFFAAIRAGQRSNALAFYFFGQAGALIVYQLFFFAGGYLTCAVLSAGLIGTTAVLMSRKWFVQRTEH